MPVIRRVVRVVKLKVKDINNDGLQEFLRDQATLFNHHYGVISAFANWYLRENPWYDDLIMDIYGVLKGTVGGTVSRIQLNTILQAFPNIDLAMLNGSLLRYILPLLKDINRCFKSMIKTCFQTRL